MTQVEENRVSVKITSRSACSKCHAKSVCSASDMSEKIISAVPETSLEKGDRVRVCMKETLGWTAVMLSFVVPLVILVTVVFTLHYFTEDELRSVLGALFALVPYYILLMLLRKTFEKRFIFRAEKC
ncbi:MAG: SoxR reducing system RseC family protein [bacterium]